MLGLFSVARVAYSLKIAICIRTAFELWDDVIHCLRRTNAVFALARLAQVAITQHYAVPDLLPSRAIATLVGTASELVLHQIAGSKMSMSHAVAMTLSGCP